MAGYVVSAMLAVFLTESGYSHGMLTTTVPLVAVAVAFYWLGYNDVKRVSNQPQERNAIVT